MKMLKIVEVEITDTKTSFYRKENYSTGNKKRKKALQAIENSQERTVALKKCL